MPVHCHLPVILAPSGKGKMSKRKAEKSGLPIFIHDFKERGYLPEAMFNWLARIGWSYDADVEVFTREEAIRHFNLKAINPKPAAAPYSKLDWLNGVYIRNLDPDDLLERLLPFLSRDLDLPPEVLREDERLRRLIPSVQERIKHLTEASALVDFLYRAPVCDPEALVPRKSTPQETLAALRAARERVAVSPFDSESLERALRGLAEDMGMKVGQVFAPIRMALTGRKVTPPLFDIMMALGKDDVLRRLDAATARLEVSLQRQPPREG
jgi:Glutamyl- and glutaminyl-tRNA synthetases